MLSPETLSSIYRNTIDWVEDPKPLTKQDIIRTYGYYSGSLFWMNIFVDNTKDFVKTDWFIIV